MHPGQLLSHLLNTAIVTAIVAALVLWRYRVGVLAGMKVGDPDELPLSPVEPPSAPVASPAADERRWVRGLTRRLVAAAVTAVLISALPLAYFQARTQVDVVTPMHVLANCGAFLIAMLPMASVLLALSFWRTVWLGARLLAGASMALVALSMVQRVITTGRAPSLDQFFNAYFFLQVTAINAALPTLALLATVFPRIRGVAPMTFVGLLVFSLAPLAGTQLTSAIASTQAGGDLVLRSGLGLGFVVLALPTGWVAWRALQAVARAFEAKRLSESEVLAHVWWALFVVLFAVEWINVHGATWGLLFVCAVAYLAFAVLYRWLVAWAAPVPRPPRRTVLLLRVFADEARTERLFDRVAARWRWLGPLTMIAAPDVVARTVDPRDFLQFASGQLRSRFVTSAADLDRHIAHLDLDPDPDGRYRVNELCCQADTWRAAVVLLMHHADAVIMDLRDFSKKRAGCAFELQQLAQRIDPQRVVLTVDTTTDRALIETHLGTSGSPRIVELPTSRIRQREFERLFRELRAAAYERATP